MSIIQSVRKLKKYDYLATILYYYYRSLSAGEVSIYIYDTQSEDINKNNEIHF